jgi:hypothetical protein
VPQEAQHQCPPESAAIAIQSALLQVVACPFEPWAEHPPVTFFISILDNASPEKFDIKLFIFSLFKLFKNLTYF